VPGDTHGHLHPVRALHLTFRYKNSGNPLCMCDNRSWFGSGAEYGAWGCRDLPQRTAPPAHPRASLRV